MIIGWVCCWFRLWITRYFLGFNVLVCWVYGSFSSFSVLDLSLFYLCVAHSLSFQSTKTPMTKNPKLRLSHFGGVGVGYVSHWIRGADWPDMQSTTIWVGVGFRFEPKNWSLNTLIVEFQKKRSLYWIWVTKLKEMKVFFCDCCYLLLCLY